MGLSLGPSLALLTDLYELTMARAYRRAGLAEREAVFHLDFRSAPFGGSFAVACGVTAAAEFLLAFRFETDDIAYLATLRDSGGEPLFDADFLDWLADLEIACDVDAVPDGTVVFPHEPLLRVRGPLAQAQMLETALLTIVNFQTLIATKAARVVHAAGGGPVLEFGLRRAQGPDGGLSASRAAYVGGVAATSNVLAGKRWGIPVRGTHAHSWVMAFGDEPAAFAAWAEAMPGNSVFLVDTYDTVAGVHNAVAAGRELRRRGHEMSGIRLDSGDLDALSRAARAILNEGGFPDAKIVASGDLDEAVIARLRAAGAPIDVWGVGTRLVVGRDDPALGGVYKLGALRDAEGRWADRLKLSDDPEKISNPGVLQVRRFERDGRPVGDLIFDERYEPATPEGWSGGRDLLRPLFRGGKLVGELPSIEESRALAAREREAFGERLFEPGYAVAWEPGVVARTRALAETVRRDRS
jgi:nicotinate phosphoribosyltransferase